ncbi:hypothetical protein [Saccharolobus shibatae]|uniref:Uncharacterized protein n=1 Tax=Saccharolobus shibatae TaxID=2286 RepID=A0A8F5GVH8_9CREN|nr:hypothetical protein [Saccharolobus shibatae]QXJ31005.1 hypothetical protein J5U21_00654 [Saccharolobus shibatae]
MKSYYIIALLIISILTPLLTINSLNFSLSENISVYANIIDSPVNVNGNYTVIKNVYSFTVTVYYGNYSAFLYPGESVTFPYQQTSNVILKAYNFEEIIKVSYND